MGTLKGPGRQGGSREGPQGLVVVSCSGVVALERMLSFQGVLAGPGEEVTSVPCKAVYSLRKKGQLGHPSSFPFPHVSWKKWPLSLGAFSGCPVLITLEVGNIASLWGWGPQRTIQQR